MPDEPEDKSAGGSPETDQAPAPEVQSAPPAAAPPFWKVGDTTYDKPENMAQDFTKLHGEYTRSRQELAKYRQDLGAYQAIVDAIRSDPRLLGEVRARINQGATQQQAVRQTAQAHQMDPEVLAKLESLETWKLEQEENYAEAEFTEKHPELADEDWKAIAKYLGDNAEWLDAAKLTPQRMLEVAYAETVVPKMSQKLIEKGQQMKEEEIQRGRKGQFLGSQAPTSQARTLEKPKGKMTPAEEREYARQVWQKSK